MVELAGKTAIPMGRIVFNSCDRLREKILEVTGQNLFLGFPVTRHDLQASIPLIENGLANRRCRRGGVSVTATKLETPILETYHWQRNLAVIICTT